MVKLVPLVVLVSLVTAAVVAAPNPPKEGLASHDAAGKAYVVRKLPGANAEGFITARLKVNYAVAGRPGETYTVELWLGLPDCPVESERARAHFDTQEVTVPRIGDRLTEVKGLFDRRHYDRLEDSKVFPPLRWFQLKPGTYSLPPVPLGKVWECRLVVKNRGKALSDTGYFRVVFPPVIDL